MTKMRIQDVRFDGFFFSNEVDRPLGNMLSDIGHHFLSKIKYQFELKDTHILIFHFGNTDNNECKSEKYYSLGEKEFGNIGHLYTYISEKYFLSLVDDEKHLFLLDILYKSIKDYAIYFNEYTELLDEAYDKMLIDGFYRNETGFVVPRNKLYRCWVEKLLNYKSAEYRLVFHDVKLKRREYFYMTKKETVFIKPNCDVKTLLTTPQFFHVEGWKKKEFRVRWGEYGSELYVFDMETKTLRMEINEVELPDFLK